MNSRVGRAVRALEFEGAHGTPYSRVIVSILGVTATKFTRVPKLLLGNPVSKAQLCETGSGSFLH